MKKTICFLLSIIFSFCILIQPVSLTGDGAHYNEIFSSYVPPIEMSDYLYYESSNQQSAVISLLSAATQGSNISYRLLDENNKAIPSVSEMVSGNINTIYVEETNSVEFYDSPAIIGMPIDISGGDSFESALLTFKLKENLPDAIICKYIDSHASTLKTTYDPINYSVSATISGTGTYFVLEPNRLLESFAFENAEVIIVVDKTGLNNETYDNAILAVDTVKDLLYQKRVNANINIINHFEMMEICYDYGNTNKISYSYPDEVSIDINSYINKGILNINGDFLHHYIVISDNKTNIGINENESLKLYNFESFLNDCENVANDIYKSLFGDENIIYLHGPIPMPIKLDAQLYEGSVVDTDGDGISDINEIGSISQSGSYNLDALAQILGFDTTMGDYGSVPLYKYNSNPTMKDTDYDGINDDLDAKPKDNSNIGIMHYPIEDTGHTCNIEFNVDYRDLLNGHNDIYSKDLSVLASLLASDVYKNLYVEITNGAINGGNDNAIAFGSMIGLDDCKFINISSNDYNVDKDDITDFFIGHKIIEYNGEMQEVIILSVRGTNETNAEWSSNFDVGADTDEYYSAIGKSHPHWLNKNNHKGFDVASNRVLEKALDYIENYVSNDFSKNILITGHSRGAAIANILGTYFENDTQFSSYTYTFATPNTTTAKDASSYKTIFNNKNIDDLIPYLPIENWGFTNYGNTLSISIKDSYESGLFAEDSGTFEELIGEDYNNDGGTQRTLDCFAAIVNTREELYIIDTSNDGTAYENSIGHITQNGAQTELEELTVTFESEKLMRFCDFSIVKSLLVYKVKINYSPAYLMQSLANMTTGVGPLLGHAISGVYATAKNSFIASSGKVVIGGLTHPHMQPTYYLIARNNFLPLS